jgi:hypothetical protein
VDDMDTLRAATPAHPSSLASAAMNSGPSWGWVTTLLLLMATVLTPLAK